MKSTICYFVRDERTRRIMHHEIEEVSAEEMLAPGYAESRSDRVAALMKRYPLESFDVFVQGFDSLATLYRIWPELLVVHVGFTGTRFGATEAQLVKMRALLAELGPNAVAHHGDCIGADAQFHAIARELGWRVAVHSGPDGDDDRAGCDHDELRAPLTHMKRNKAIVVESHRVMAVPKDMTPQPYGGTWKTIEMARKAKKPLVIVFPDGSVEGSW